MMDRRLSVLPVLAFILLGVAEVSSVTPNGMLGTCALTNLIPSSSGAYITISQDSAGIDADGEFWAQSETAAFGETVYFDCSNASVAGTVNYANVWDNSTVSIDTTCFNLKEAYQQGSCCNQTVTHPATFDNLDLTCGDLLSSYTGSECCSADLEKNATMTANRVRIVSAQPQTSEFSCQARNVMSIHPSTYGSSSVEIGRIFSPSDIPEDTNLARPSSQITATTAPRTSSIRLKELVPGHT